MCIPSSPKERVNEKFELIRKATIINMIVAKDSLKYDPDDIVAHAESQREPGG